MMRLYIWGYMLTVRDVITGGAADMECNLLSPKLIQNTNRESLLINQFSFINIKV